MVNFAVRVHSGVPRNVEPGHRVIADQPHQGDQDRPDAREGPARE